MVRTVKDIRMTGLKTGIRYSFTKVIESNGDTIKYYVRQLKNNHWSEPQEINKERFERAFKYYISLHKRPISS